MSDAQTVAPFAIVEQPLRTWEKLYNSGAVRKTILLVLLALVWEGYAKALDKEVLIPTLSATIGAFLETIRSGELPRAARHSIELLLKGYALGLILAGVLAAFASATRIGADLLEILTSMFNPLPSVALMPLALTWFGFGNGSVIFVLVHAVLWAVALNTHAGFRAVSPTLRMVGQNYGLSKPAYIMRILIPGAFPTILTGLKVGWAFAWRTLIAAELVFGVTTSGDGGLGWFIYEHKQYVLVPEAFAGLLTVILFGLVVENVIFRTIEARTVRRWGMQT